MIETIYKNFKEEAEHFFVNRFVESKKVKEAFIRSLEIMFVTEVKRGIIAFSKKYGQGKTFFFDVVNHRYLRTRGKNFVKKVSSKDLIRVYLECEKNQNPQQELIEFISCKRLLIDDLGDEGEQNIYKHYANELFVVQFVLYKRYEMFMSKGWLTFITTNLTEAEIQKKYGGRVADRLEQMTKRIDFTFLGDGSFRQFKDVRMLSAEEKYKNFLKLHPKKDSEEKIDIVAFMNELIQEPDEEYFEGKGNDFWLMVKDFLISKGITTEEEIEKAKEIEFKAASGLLKREVYILYSSMYKHAPSGIKKRNIQQAQNSITNDDVKQYMKNFFVKKKLFELRKSKHIFSYE